MKPACCFQSKGLQKSVGRLMDALYHCDAVQVAGKAPIDARKLAAGSSHGDSQPQPHAASHFSFGPHDLHRTFPQPGPLVRVSGIARLATIRMLREGARISRLTST